MVTKKPNAPAKDVRALFAGELDYANVTEFRESLLPVVSDLERNPTKRFLVTKHGKPLAVFLSFEAFEAVRRLVESVLADEDAKDVSQVLREASHRMDRDHGVETPTSLELSACTPEQLSIQIQAFRNDFQRIESLLTAYAKGTPQTREEAGSR